ncbi:hypothetical protein AVEN_155004-1 [Araneus ventricosus]|uniref:Uncharacterized protein n=1 Tax=Araneus ventricosus TaxID=182803 RepID=A0A4Y2A810_ARAVE|nr:hypothetical protein AVEN_155004-1 [Araneus ventricosus]
MTSSRERQPGTVNPAQKPPLRMAHATTPRFTGVRHLRWAPRDPPPLLENLLTYRAASHPCAKDEIMPSVCALKCRGYLMKISLQALYHATMLSDYAVYAGVDPGFFRGSFIWKKIFV